MVCAGPLRRRCRCHADAMPMPCRSIKTVQEQETSKAQARTEQLKKEIQRTKEVQDAQRQKE